MCCLELNFLNILFKELKMITEEKLKKLATKESKIWNTFKPPQMTQKLNHFVLKSHSNKKSFKLFVFLSIGKSATHRHFKFFLQKDEKIPTTSRSDLYSEISAENQPTIVSSHIQLYNILLPIQTKLNLTFQIWFCQFYILRHVFE